MSFEQPITLDDNWFTGEDKSMSAVIYEAGTTQEEAEADTGVRQDITGWTIQWALRKNQWGADAILVKTGTAVGDPTLGEVQAGIDHGDTTGLTPGEYFHTWARIDGGNQTVLVFGDATLRQGAIR